MTERRTTFGADPENVRQFLDDCLAAGPPPERVSETAEMTQWLQDQLSEKCPVPKPSTSSQTWLLDRVQEKVRLDLSRSVGEVLSDRQADLNILRDIKDRYKSWTREAATKGMRHVYTAIYFAAIARALVSHSQTITDHPTEYLVRSMKTLAGEPWMVPSLRELYLEALQVCDRTP